MSTKSEVKENYNTFTINPMDIPALLSGYPKTKKDVDGAMLELVKTSHDSSHSSYVVLDSFIWLKLSNGYDGYECRFYIGMCDGLPAQYVPKVVKVLDELKIRYRLNS